MTDPQAPAATGWRAHTPNALTILRLLLTAVFVVVLVFADPAAATWSAPLIVGLALFILAAVSDAADGYLARRWNAVSRFGRVADPFADKVLILSAFIMLAGPDLGPHTGVATWMVVLILARELLVTTIRGVYEGEGIDFSATASGKLKMIVQSVAVPVALLDGAAPVGPESTGPHPVNLGLLYLTVIITVWSAIPYVARAARAQRELSRSGT
jgi:CDP-diacylglycerol--glycerol-3-phosphate 3-phosphatidyltransferase